MIYPNKEHTPYIHPKAFIADNAAITGDVIIGEQSSIWFSVVISGDVAPTRIGNRVNIQDLSCLHQIPNRTLLIEDDATIGHQVT
ncbi:gamma carbonic anhydrase family protein, partial [Bacillus vallismortis]|nr:gamma carbonic anhydrase family protein [Bacillus vallismortis]